MWINVLYSASLATPIRLACTTCVNTKAVTTNYDIDFSCLIRTVELV